jgi:hypothetical protein
LATFFIWPSLIPEPLKKMPLFTSSTKQLRTNLDRLGCQTSAGLCAYSDLLCT